MANMTFLTKVKVLKTILIQEKSTNFMSFRKEVTLKHWTTKAQTKDKATCCLLLFFFQRFREEIEEEKGRFLA